MWPTEPLGNAEDLTSEFTRLSYLQSSAMQKAAFVGMTDEEALEYSRRAARIESLVKQLKAISATGKAA